MIKNTTTRKPPAPLTLSHENVATIADYLTRAGDMTRVQTEERIENLNANVRSDSDRIESRERDIREYRDSIESARAEIRGLETTLANTPRPAPVTADEVTADIQRALALPYVKSISVVQDTDDSKDTRAFVVVHTRANALHTTLARKFSRAMRWYRSAKYQVPLPEYKIRIGMTMHNSLALTRNALAIALANPEDTAHFLTWISRYQQEVYPHWGTSSVPSDEHGAYRAVCLGEFESEITRAFHKSIADGLMAFAIYLQSAGSTHAYISKREVWALWLGKKEYNFAVVPSEEEEKVLETTPAADDEDDTRERDCGCMEDEDGNSLCSGECECDCHD